MKLRNKIVTLVCLIGSVLAFNTRAENREDFRAALEACASETGVSKPEPGVRPSDADREKIRACLDSKGFTKPNERGHYGERQDPERKAFHEAVRSCAEENGIQKPAHGERPSEEDRSKIDACLTAKGVSKPARATKASAQ